MVWNLRIAYRLGVLAYTLFDESSILLLIPLIFEASKMSLWKHKWWENHHVSAENTELVGGFNPYEKY